MKRLVGVLGRAVVDDVEVEIAVLVEVEPAGHERDGGRSARLEHRRDILERLAVTIAQEAVAADAGQEKVDVAIGVEVGRGDAQAGAILGQPERGRGILETAVPFVQKQDVVNALWSDHGRGQEQVELGRRRRRRKRQRPRRSGRARGRSPPREPVKSDGLTHRSPSGSLTCNGWAASKFSGTAAVSTARSVRVKGIDRRSHIFPSRRTLCRRSRPGPATGPGDRDSSSSTARAAPWYSWASPVNREVIAIL